MSGLNQERNKTWLSNEQLNTLEIAD